MTSLKPGTIVRGLHSQRTMEVLPGNKVRVIKAGMHPHRTHNQIGFIESDAHLMYLKVIRSADCLRK